MNRYNRQMILPDFGANGQQKLQSSRALIIGAGGLGCPVIQYLAGAGVGHILIADPDRIEETNLHRQPIYKTDDVGKFKAVVACELATALNPDVTAEPVTQQIGAGNASEFMIGADIVVDCADNFAVSYILSEECFRQKIPLISASALDQNGYVGGFCGAAPSLRAVFPDLPQSSATCATAGVMGPAVGTIGALQAQFALRVLLGADPSPLGKMVTANLADMTFGSFDFITSEEPETALPFLSLGMVTPDDHVIELRADADLLHPNAQRCAIDDLLSTPLPTDKRIILCCRTGLRSWRAAEKLAENGYDNLALMAATACQ
ncbi:thiamine biosynthesis protein ThiF [Marivivens niveibacter]|uniref:Thiamine biosynthesis protein ThiF n=2 Tax=Marivivens niveibacter TaxID=1930667 RepID=A0A251WVW0_9RHOB|nr:thiamine biosynthesis protein ThiF [Marivivens niveibacter]